MNVDNLILYEVALITKDASIILPLVEDLAPNHMNVLVEHAVL